MAEPSLEYIGTTLLRVQQEMRELRMAVRTNWDETRTMHDLLRQDMHRIILEVHSRIDAFDQRFTYFDEALNNLRQDMEKSIKHLQRDVETSINNLRQEMATSINHLRQDVEISFNGLRQEMNGQFAEIKSLLTNGK